MKVRYQITAVHRQEEAIRRREARLGWRVQVTNLPRERLSLAGSVLAYRGGWSLERDFHLLKDRPLGIRPLHVRRDDQVVGLRTVTLALRVLTLLEVLVRRGQEESGKKLAGLYAGQASRTTDARRDRGCWRRSAGGDHGDGGGRWGATAMASQSPAGAGVRGAVVVGFIRGDIQQDIAWFKLRYTR